MRGTDACGPVELMAGAAAANVFQAVVALDAPDSAQVFAPGTYGLGNGWQASYRMSDGTCATADEGAAVKGTLEIDAVDTSIHGIADMTFPAGRVIASFVAPLCEPAGPANVGSTCEKVPPCPAGQGTDLRLRPDRDVHRVPLRRGGAAEELLQEALRGRGVSGSARDSPQSSCR